MLRVVVCVALGAGLCWRLLRRSSCDRKVLRPRSRYDGTVESLGGMDMFIGRVRVRFGLRFDSILDSDSVEAALIKTIDVFPFISGRLDSNFFSRQIPFVERFDSGVDFYVIDNHCAQLSHLPASSSTWARFHGFAGPSQSFPGKDTTLFAAKLCRFHVSGVSVLFVDFAHITGDLWSHAQFLKVWSHFTSAPDSPLPPELTPSSFNARRNRLGGQHGSAATEVRQRMEQEGANGRGFGAVLRGILWAHVGNMLWNRRIVLALDGRGFQELKRSVSASLKPGEWVSTYEVMVGSFLAAKAAAQGPRDQRSFSKVGFVVNLRGHVSDDKLAFPPNLFSNALGSVEVDLTGIFEDVEESDPQAAVTKAVWRVHCELRRGLANSEVLCHGHTLWDAAQEVLPPGEVLDMLGRTRNERFLQSQAGERLIFNEWLSSGLLDVDFGSAQPVQEFIPVTSTNLAPGVMVLMPLNRAGDCTLPCCMAHKEALSFLQTASEWGLPITLLSG